MTALFVVRCLWRGGLRGAGVGEGFEGIGEGGEHEEDGFDFGDFEYFEDAWVDAGEGDAASGFLAGGIGADQRAEAGGIEIGDAGEIQNHGGGAFAADGVEEWGNVLHGERAVEAEDSAINVLDLHWLRYHRVAILGLVDERGQTEC